MVFGNDLPEYANTLDAGHFAVDPILDSDDLEGHLAAYGFALHRNTW